MEALSKQSSTGFAEAARTKPFTNPAEPGLGLGSPRPGPGPLRGPAAQALRVRGRPALPHAGLWVAGRPRP